MAIRDLALVTATAASLALAATLLLLPDAPWRFPLALAGGLWAPGYALVALLYRGGRLSRIERHALAVAAGLLLAPLAGLVASETVGFRPASIAGVLALLTAGFALGAARRARGVEPPAHASVPRTLPTLAIAGGALLFAGALAAPALLTPDVVPASLALERDGRALGTLEAPRGSALALEVVARAGSAQVEDVLLVRWNGTLLHEERLLLAPGEEHRVALEIHVPTRGAQLLEAAWAGREVHASLRAEAPR